MAKRPQFNLPSTKPAGDAAKTEWVYRTDAPAVPSEGDPYRIVAKYSQYAAAVGFIPLPGFDVVAFGGLQLRMIAELCAHYAVPFSSQLGRSIVATLIGTVAPARLGMSLVPLLGVVTGPSLGYTATWTIGRAFMRHFESGGTLSNFRPSDLSPDRVDA
ncbi:MAG TPA: hypothetical protein VNT81_14145 [Vicinamibacterales bacterium]|nr:hypothetical protein [Vicinamibacterales bacterium]